MHKSKRAVWLIFLVFLLANMIVVINCERGKAAGKEIFVDDNGPLPRDGSAEHPYKTINEALRVAQDGDTIYVFGGLYNETLNINKRVTMVGSIEEGGSNITYGSDHKYTIEITADYVNFSGFNIHDQGNKVISEIGGALIRVTSSNVIIQDNNITDCTNGWGIFLDSSGNNILRNNNINKMINGIYAVSSNTNDYVGNKISNCSSSGIKIQSSHHNTLYNNTFNKNIYGVYVLDSEYININNNTMNNSNIRGIGIFRGSDNTISYNLILNSANQGLYLDSPYSSILNNIFRYNPIGIKTDVSYCIIYNNVINNSLSVGIHMTSGTKDNKVYLNHFNNNSQNALEDGKNVWDNVSSMQGNYWDDYKNVDRDHDGIGDVAYEKNGVYDEYPLGIFLRPPNKPRDPAPPDGKDNVGLKITLAVWVSDPDKERMRVSFYRVENESITLLGVVPDAFSDSNVSISFNLNFTTNFAWFVVANDSRLENQSNIWFFTTRQRPKINVPPVPVASGPSYVMLDQPVVFDASGSYDRDGTIEFYRWNFGDGTSEILSISPTHVYSSKETSGGTYNVTLTVIDNNGTSANKVIKIKVASSTENILPVADAGGPYSGDVDSAIKFVGSGSTDDDGSISSWYWTFGDGGSSTLPDPSHTYTQAGKYTAVLKVTDNSGGTDTISADVTVNSKTSEGSPGFELVIAIASIALVLVLRRRKL